jgi:hypothetical protein
MKLGKEDRVTALCLAGEAGSNLHQNSKSGSSCQHVVITVSFKDCHSQTQSGTSFYKCTRQSQLEGEFEGVGAQSFLEERQQQDCSARAVVLEVGAVEGTVVAASDCKYLLACVNSFMGLNLRLWEMMAT